MKKKQLYLLSLAFVGLFGHSNAQCAWESLGPNDTNVISFGQTEYNSVAIDPTTGNAYVGYWDENYYSAGVSEYVASTGLWQSVGLNTICTKKTAYTSITVDKHGIVYFACQNPNKALSCNVWMYNSFTQMWDTLSPVSFGSPAQWISLKTDKNGVPYVAYEDLGHGDKLDVFMYNGTNWTPVGGSIGISKGQAQYVSLAFDTVNNIPYVAFEDGKHADNAAVYSYNGTSWSAVGGVADTNGVTTDTAAWTSLTVDKNGHPYLAYEDYSNGKGVSVMMYNGTTWSAVGNASLTTGGPVTYVKVGVDGSDNVYVSFTDGSSFGKSGLSAIEYNGTAWNYVGGSYKVSQNFAMGKAQYSDMTLDYNGMPAIVTQDNGVGDHAELYRYNSTSKYWYIDRGEGFSDIGSFGTKNGTAKYISIGANPVSNDIYASYSDGNTGYGKASVMEYHAGTWSAVGSLGISASYAKFTQIGFDKAGDPICLFSDYGASNKYGLSCEIFKGGSWSQIGTGLSDSSGANAYYPSMIVANDTVYCAFELSANYALAVIKCPVSGGTWKFVGCTAAKGIQDSAADESITIDKNGQLYVAFQDNATNGNGATVMKYHNGWQYVGARSFNASGQVVYPSIQIDPKDNMPVVAYSAYAGSYNAHCQKFDGTNWNFIGPSAGFSDDWTDYMNLVIDHTGAYFVAYQDWGNKIINLGQRNITVEKFDPISDTTWRVLPTGTSCSIGGSSYQSMAVDNAGNVYVGYTGVSGFVKELGCPTGINEIGSSNNVSANLYPNPNHGSFTIALQNATGKSYVTMYNVLGENVYSSKLTSDKTEVNMNNQAPGIYLYRITTENGQIVSTGKLIIQ